MMLRDNNITVILADDHPLVRSGFMSSISDTRDISVICDTGSAKDACIEYKKRNPDVIILDILFEGEKFTGLDAAVDILNFDRNARIIILSQHDQPVFIKNAYRTGALAFIPKQENPAVLIDAIRNVAKGHLVCLPKYEELIKEEGVENDNKAQQKLKDILTERELEIYMLIAAGKSYAEIATHLGIIQKTIYNTAVKIRSKLGLKSNSDITKHCLIEEVDNPYKVLKSDELEIYKLISANKSYNDIASVLGLTEYTVITMAHSIRTKLGLKTKSDVIMNVAKYDLNSPTVLLSGREKEVYELMKLGKSAKHISEKLCLNSTTVRSHLHSIRTKLNIKKNTTIEQYANIYEAGNPKIALTDREYEIYKLIAMGYSHTEIANTIHMHTRSVYNFIQNVRKKLYLQSDHDIILHAIKYDVVKLK